MSESIQITLIVLQTFQVLILWLHDWIPLGRLNDVDTIYKMDGYRNLAIVTIFQSVPWTLGLGFSIAYFGQGWPSWVHDWLWISYLILFIGELRAWWVPYLLWPDAKRAERYQKMFGNTHSFLPMRNGIMPNTLHVTLHVATLMTVLILFACR